MKRAILLGIGIGLLAGFWLGRGCTSRSSASATNEAAVTTASHPAEVWTCSMHPQIRQPKPGKCPICGMDLILAGSGETTVTTAELELSAAAQKLADVETAPAERQSVAVDLRLAGKIQPDETRVAVIAPRVAGRIDKLAANYVGMAVKAGEPLAELYSPELVSAQQELLQAARLPGGGAAADSLLAATRERLRLWGLTAEPDSGCCPNSL